MGRGTRQETWQGGIEHELDWWRRYLSTGGLEWPEDFRARTDPSTPLQPHVVRTLGTVAKSADGAPAILDCAAGPLTILGKLIDGRPVSLTAVNALATHYDALLDELGIDPPVRTIQCDVERLEEHFPPSAFDLVYMRFALDHCYEPALALRQMVGRIRPGGSVMVEHYRDPTETTYQGLRQWDLVPSEHNLEIVGGDERISVAGIFPERRITIEASPTWLTLLIR